MLLKIIAAGLSVICFSICFEIPRRFLMYSGITGSIGWCIYLMMISNDKSVALSTFVAAMVVTVLSQIGARIYKTPVTVFLIAGILPLVPGRGMYRTVYYVLHSNDKYSSFYLVQTLLSAGAIALAIFIIDSVYRLLTNQDRHLREKHFSAESTENIESQILESDKERDK